MVYMVVDTQRATESSAAARADKIRKTDSLSMGRVKRTGKRSMKRAIHEPAVRASRSVIEFGVWGASGERKGRGVVLNIRCPYRTAPSWAAFNGSRDHGGGWRVPTTVGIAAGGLRDTRLSFWVCGAS